MATIRTSTPSFLVCRSLLHVFSIHIGFHITACFYTCSTPLFKPRVALQCSSCILFVRATGYNGVERQLRNTHCNKLYYSTRLRLLLWASVKMICFCVFKTTFARFYRFVDGPMSNIALEDEMRVLSTLYKCPKVNIEEDEPDAVSCPSAL